MEPTPRTLINRQNAQLSTGPVTPDGKQRSSQNSFKHGLYSHALILPTENPRDFNELREALHTEHQPATPTETLLVEELVQSAWRIRRFRRIELSALDSGVCLADIDTALLALAQRALASAERAFHRALTALRQLQRDRGFVPHLRAQPNPEPDRAPLPEQPVSGFVPSRDNQIAAHAHQRTDSREESVPPPACAQPGRLASMG